MNRIRILDGGLVAAFFLCAFLALMLENRFAVMPALLQGRDPLTRMLGSAKEGLGDILFLKADEYHHGGDTYVFEENSETEYGEGFLSRRDETAAEDWVQKILNQVRSRRHYHLHREDEKELLPFMTWAVELDPHNIEAILTTAFYLDRHFNRPIAARDLLLKGRRDNPGSWEITRDLAKFYFERRKDYAASEPIFRQAIVLSKDKTTEHDARAGMMYLLAESCRLQGKTDAALDAYRQALLAFDSPGPLPLKESIIRNITELSKEQK